MIPVALATLISKKKRVKINEETPELYAPFIQFFGMATQKFENVLLYKLRGERKKWLNPSDLP